MDRINIFDPGLIFSIAAVPYPISSTRSMTSFGTTGSGVRARVGHTCVTSASISVSEGW